MLFSVFPDAKKSEINPKQKSSGIHSIHLIFGTVRIKLVRYAFIVRSINGKTSLYSEAEYIIIVVD